MTHIDDLHDRISRALDRISQRVEGFDPAAAAADDARIEQAREQIEENQRALDAAQADARAAHIEANVAREAAELAAEQTRALEEQLEQVREQLADARKTAAEVAAAAHEASPVADVDDLVETPAPDAGALDAAVSAGDSAELDSLREELEDEKMANAQLQERLKTLKARLAELEEAGGPEAGQQAPEQSALQDRMAELDAELQGLRAANTALETSIASLREANAQNLGDSELINKSMQAEIISLKATRRAEHAESATVLAAMEPLLAEAAEETA